MGTPIRDEFLARAGELFKSGPDDGSQLQWVVLQLGVAIASIERRIDEIDPNVELPEPSLADSRARVDEWHESRKILGLD